MPIKVKSTVFSGMNALEASLKEVALSAMDATVSQTTKEIRGRQANNEFWNNRSGNALEAISGELDEPRSGVISGSVGFEDGKPNEKDAPDYYSGRDHEYAEYIADRDQLSFLGSIQQALTRNFGAAMEKLGRTASASSSRMTRKRGVVSE